MISYPGDIQARFGRYEAIERLGPLERGVLWRAWDPFLERFVAIVSLTDLNAEEIHDQVPTLEEELPRWLGQWHRSGLRVLDFAPAGPETTAFVVVDLPDPASEAAAAPASNDMPAIGPSTTWPPPARRLALVGGLALLGGIIYWLAA